MSEFFNDSPIETDGDDRYGIAPFAKSIAKSILNMHRPVGVTIAIYGPWGSGKSSAINLIRSGLKEAEKNQELVVTDFKCWWYRGEEALALAFLQDLNAALTRGLGDKIKDLIPKLSRPRVAGRPRYWRDHFHDERSTFVELYNLQIISVRQHILLEQRHG